MPVGDYGSGSGSETDSKVEGAAEPIYGSAQEFEADLERLIEEIEVVGSGGTYSGDAASPELRKVMDEALSDIETFSGYYADSRSMLSVFIGAEAIASAAFYLVRDYALKCGITTDPNAFNIAWIGTAAPIALICLAAYRNMKENMEMYRTQLLDNIRPALGNIMEDRGEDYLIGMLYRVKRKLGGQ